MANLTDLLTIGLIGIGGYYLYSTGALNSILGGPPAPSIDVFPKETEEDEDDDDDDDEEKKGGGGKRGGGGKKEGGGGKRRKRDRDRDEQPQQQMPPPGYGYPPQGPQYPPQYPAQMSYPTGAPAPGLISSLYPMDVPQGPPYFSTPVNTYSQYSPYNQFTAYQEYRTPPRGVSSTMADDNINFSDIDISKYGCNACYYQCKGNPYSLGCATCRMPCKRVSHQFIPPARGWTIGPAQTPVQNYPTGSTYSPYQSQSYLGQVWDTLTGKGATFAEMDDYSQEKRFDCHNKLKRRVIGKNNSFVNQDDYYDDFNRIQFHVE